MPEHKSVFTYKDIAEASGNAVISVSVAVSKKRLNPDSFKSICDYVNYKTLTELEEMKRLTRFWKAKAEEKEELVYNCNCSCYPIK